MSYDYWLKKWQENDIRFHLTRFHPALEKYAENFLPGKILVPLCGKSLDMIYLASKGHFVIGVELSIIACRDFFSENGIKFNESSYGEFVLLESESITLWCGDFFKLPQHVWDEVSGIYDRAALVALTEDLRLLYAIEISSRIVKPVGVLLVAFEYPDNSIQGPPFSVSEKEISRIFTSFQIKKLQAEKDSNFKDHPTLRSVVLTETVYWLLKDRS